MKLYRYILAAVVICGAFASYEPPARAYCYGLDNASYELLARETITVSTTAIGGTAATYAPSGEKTAVIALFTIESNPIRFREDGIAPTSSVGTPVSAPNTIEVCGATAIRNFQMIRSGGADATAWAQYLVRGR